MSQRTDFEPQTVREALLEIRRKVAASDLNTPDGQLAIEIDLIAERGLTRRDLVNFELTDLLADRLAEAHDLLRKIDNGHYEPEALTPDLKAALALPPDLEAMVERRIGPA